MTFKLNSFRPRLHDLSKVYRGHCNVHGETWFYLSSYRCAACGLERVRRYHMRKKYGEITAPKRRQGRPKNVTEPKIIMRVPEEPKAPKAIVVPEPPFIKPLTTEQKMVRRA